MSRRLDPDPSRALWREAADFAALCALGARFVRGEIGYFPGWNAHALDLESDEIAAHLERCCQNGFLTCASQPARADQRAFALGFASRTSALRLATIDAGLDVRLFGLRDERSESHPVSRHDGRFHAFAGHDARSEELDTFEEDLSPTAIAELSRCVYVSAFDPEWGRAGRLWDALERAWSAR